MRCLLESNKRSNQHVGGGHVDPTQMPKAEAGPIRGLRRGGEAPVGRWGKYIVPALVGSISIQHMLCSRTNGNGYNSISDQPGID